MIFRLIFFLLFIISSLATFFPRTSGVDAVVVSAILSKIYLYIFFVMNITKSKLNILMPNNLFVTIFFVFITGGELIWLLRESLFYNTPGNPISISQEFLVIFIAFVFVNLLINYKFRLKNRINILNYYKITRDGYLILSLMGFVGIFIFTRGFTVLPIFSGNIDKGRALIVEAAGVGIGFVLLVTSVYLFIFLMFEYLKNREVKYLFFAIISYFPFILYGGRSLMVFPFFMFVCLNYSSVNINYSIVLKSIIAIILVFILTSFFSLIREYGKIDLNSPDQINFYFGDLFPEFRSLVNTFDVTNNSKYGDIFIGNLFYGQIPGFFFDMLNLDKNDYYVTIGKIVTSNTSYSDFSGGIRLSLIGEIMIMSNTYKYIFLVLIQLVLTIGTFGLFSKHVTRNRLNNIVVSYLVVFAFPYGLNFIMNAIQLYVFFMMINKLIFIFSRRKFLRKTQLAKHNIRNK